MVVFLELEKNKEERLFDFVMTVPSVVDKEGEVMPESEMEEALDRWLINGSPISMEHTNKIVGKGLRWWADEYKGNKAYIARGLINKGPVADVAWDKILKEEYKDVSLGGAAFDPTKLKDGSTELRGLDVLEVALCEDGMHPDADILDKNAMAKGQKYYFAKAKIKKINKEDITFKSDSLQLSILKELKKLNELKGGQNMVKKEEEKKPITTDEKPKPKTEEDKEDEKKPKTEDETPEKKKSQYVTKEDFDKFTKEVIAAINDGGEPSPDNLEEDSPEGEPSVAETDEGKGKGEDGVISNLPDSNKSIEDLVKAEVKKTLAVAKSTTPRPNQVIKNNEKMDAYEVAKGKPANFSEIRDHKRQTEEKELKSILGVD